MAAAAAVFEIGKFDIVVITKDPSKKEEASSPPSPLLIVYPTVAGTYPVLLFLHGFCLHNSYYTDLLRHVASHGAIVVAPQFKLISLPKEDIADAAAVTDWLRTGLAPLLPEGVTPNLDQLALAGHSRGGHTAFSLALGHAKTALRFSLLVGIDPVAGISSECQVSPKILTYVPSSFAIDFPVLVIGTGLGSQSKDYVLPPCAPERVNHEEFYAECRPTCYHLVAKEYGHMDMLDDRVAQPQKELCKCGCGKTDAMRRTTAGLVVAFLKEYFGGKQGLLDSIVSNTGLAPAILDSVAVRRREASGLGAVRSKL